MSSSCPLLTICIPCYDQPDYLAACLHSIQSQTFQDFVIIVADDNSEADYQPTLQRFGNLRIEYVRNQKNLGAIANMFKSLHRDVESDFMMVFHEDDLMHPRLLEWEVRILQQRHRVMFVGTEMAFFRSGPLPELSPDLTGDYEIYTEVSQFVRTLLNGAPFNFGSVMYRRSGLHEVTEDYARFLTLCDRPFLCEIAKGGHSAFIREPLVYYRVHEPDLRGNDLTEEHLIELYRYYRTCLPRLWNRSDRRLFFARSTNSLLESHPRLTEENKGSWLRFILKSMRAGVFHLLFLNRQGLTALINHLLGDSRIMPRGIGRNIFCAD